LWKFLWRCLRVKKRILMSFILLQIMRCYLLSGDLDRALQVFNDYMNSMKPSFIELYTVLIEGAMVGHTPRGMQIALDKLEEMTQRSFFLFPKIANDLLLIAAGDKKGGYTTANYIWDLTQARKMPLSFPAVEAYYNGLKGRCVPEDDPRWLLVSSTYERLRPRSGAGTGPARQQAQNIKTDTKERMAS
ncbi:hypothetical protein D5086_003021, partial [Populus alba]